jgi:hypothetical protein
MSHNGRVTPPTTTGTNRQPKADAVLTAAVDVARAALLEAVPADEVGEHCGAVTEADRVTTHWFAAERRGYVGWRWAVTLTRAPRHKVATVNEIVLLPGEDALVAPEWVPWKDRVGKHDLRPGDLVPIPESDLRLVPGYLVGDEALDGVTAREVREVIREVGLGRERVLSIDGRDEAAERWYAGDNGPDTPMAKAAPASCGSCGFLVRMAGSLATMFGVCANSASPSDGQVVSFDHGCGAHSDVRAEASVHQPATASPFMDTIGWDVFDDVDLDP